MFYFEQLQAVTLLLNHRPQTFRSKILSEQKNIMDGQFKFLVISVFR